MQKSPIAAQTCFTRLALVALMFWQWSAMAGVGDLCGERSPAFPVAEFRDGVRLWPADLQPALPFDRLPSTRDSTDYRSHTYPTFTTGHELFQALDIVDERLYVAYGTGLQVWDVGPGFETRPRRLDVAAGELEHFLEFGNFISNELDTWLFSIDAGVDPGSQDHLLAVAGDPPAGVSVWRNVQGADGLAQAYQDNGPATRQLRLIDHGDKAYALAAVKFANGGVAVYDASRALELAPCLDDSSRGIRACDGVFRGWLGDRRRWVRYVAAASHKGKIYVALSDGSDFVSLPLQLEIWELDDPVNPSAARQIFALDGASGVEDIRGLEFFTWGGRTYLAYVEAQEVKIVRVDTCFDTGDCGTFEPAARFALSSRSAQARLLTFSTSEGRPFLYHSVFTGNLSGPRVEALIDLSRLGGPGQLREITASGGTYTDACNGLTVDYWGDYYEKNDQGLRNVVPNGGRFGGRYFYRAARGILDVHVYTPTDTIFADGFESGNTGAWALP